jgi:hypothetical protein
MRGYETAARGAKRTYAFLSGSFGLRKSGTKYLDGIDPHVTMHLALGARSMLTWVN